MTLLDSGRSELAVLTFEQLLRVDRSWPVISDWLVRAKACAHRATEAREASAQQLYIAPSAVESDQQLNEALLRAGLRPQHDLMPSADFYTLLGVSVDHTPEELKKLMVKSFWPKK